MRYEKRDFPLVRAREHLEAGPVVLVTSCLHGRLNVMTMGWHTMMQFSPALLGCYLWEGNRTHAAIVQTRECVINIPTFEIVDQVVRIGNMHAEDGDKFVETGLTAVPGACVSAPQIAECYASFECRLYADPTMDEYSFFIWEIVKASVAPVEAPRTLHYRGQGKFMIAGEEASFAERFRSENL